MLILSRRPRERIVFPALDVRVEVVRVQGNSVRLGVEAPEGVRVFREEILDRFRDAIEERSTVLSKSQRHTLRNHLQTVSLAISLAEQHLESGDAEQAERVLERALKKIAEADALLGGRSGQSESSDSDEQQAPTTSNIRASRRLALLVEDNANESELLAQLLKMHGFQVAKARDGRAALAQLEGGLRPDVVLLDMQMPQLDGAATIAELRDHPQLRSLPVLAVSGLEPAETSVEIGPRGVNAWFRKPVDAGSLVKAIRKTIDDEEKTVTLGSGA